MSAKDFANTVVSEGAISYTPLTLEVALVLKHWWLMRVNLGIRCTCRDQSVSSFWRRCRGIIEINNTRSQNRDDLGYDSEPERTLLRRRREARRRERQTALEQQLNMAAEHNDDNFNNAENQNRVTLGQCNTPRFHHPA
ncbi:hypothetical protein PIB30_085161 [Stylosanthes scabra]|uniref:Uncharacterized protein n=1 Tax=Stylosanthes scabra TaxID=79078 RepID=A0ABU6YRZ6_9FABA|nr:hypothetical protein [Stylosanthes scabra]